MSRVVEVGTDRLPRWLSGFADRHGGATVDGGTVTGGDGTTAWLASWQRLDGATSFEGLVGLARPPARIGLVLVRRGGYAVGVAEGDRLAARKVGRRHVQSRTAAGGWSQQRFARRRGNQADQLVDAVREHAVRLLASERPEGLVRGGDRALVAAVLADRRLRHLLELPTRDLYDLPDPSPAVLQGALDRARSVRIVLSG